MRIEGFAAAGPPERPVFLGVPIDPLTMAETLARAEHAIRTRTPLHHVVVNVAKLVSLQHDAELRRDVLESDLINADGMGVVWGARLCGHRIPERVTGIDLMIALLERCAQDGHACYFLGARPDVLERAIANLRQRLPGLQIAGYRDGYFGADEEASVVAAIRAAGADCLFVAMPSPSKERFLRRHRNRLGTSFIMGVGGSIDVIAGVVQRAPGWMQAAGLEWFYRLVQEPRRMWRRYLGTNARYLALLLRELVRSRAISASARQSGRN